MSDLHDPTTFAEPGQLRDLARQGRTLAIMDVRSPEDLAGGHDEGAVDIPADQLAPACRKSPPSW